MRGIEEDPSGCKPPVGKGWDNEPTDESETANPAQNRDNHNNIGMLPY